MKHRFLVITEEGSAATVTHVYSDRVVEATSHFDDIPSAWDWANRQAEEDSAHVLFKGTVGYLDVTNDEFAKSVRRLRVAALR